MGANSRVFAKTQVPKRPLLVFLKQSFFKKAFGQPINIKSSGRLYKFGNASHDGVSIMTIRFLVSARNLAEIEAEIVDVNIPFLLELDVLRKFKTILDFVGNDTKSKCDEWMLPITQKMGHLYFEWTPSIFYTEQKLHQVHRHFFHPKTNRLTNLIKRADPKVDISRVYSDLEKFNATSDVCQRESNLPHRFCIALPDGVCIFNGVVPLDLMFLDGKPVLHVGDRDTKFGAAYFLEKETTSGILKTISVYLGCPIYWFPRYN